MDGSHGVGGLYGRALLFFILIQIASVQVDKMKVEEVFKEGQKPAVLDAMALLQKLDENKRGGIDPIGSLERIMVHVERNPQGQPRPLSEVCGIQKAATTPNSRDRALA